MSKPRVFHGDNREVLRSLIEQGVQVDAVVTDPPYHLTQVSRHGSPRQIDLNTPYGRTRLGAKGFMGKTWDGGDIAHRADFWQLVLQVLKPGGHMLAFGGTRTYHRMVVAIEDAGFEIRDQLAWVYGSGMPKSLNFGCVCKQGNALPYNQIDGAASDTQHHLRSVRSADLSETLNASNKSAQALFASVSEQDLQERGSARTESQVGGRKQSRMEGRLVHRTGKRLQDDSVAETSAGTQQRLRSGAHRSSREEIGAQIETGRRDSSQESGSVRQSPRQHPSLSVAQRALDTQSPENGALCPTCGRLQAFAGFGTALKPALEPICLARKPLSESTVAANVLKHGTGAINVDGSRIQAERKTGWGGKAAGGITWNETNSGMCKDGTPRPVSGRWPANLLLDEDAAATLDEQSGQLSQCGGPKTTTHDHGMVGIGTPGTIYREDNRGASRFFFVARNSRCALCDCKMESCAANTAGAKQSDQGDAFVDSDALRLQQPSCADTSASSKSNAKRATESSKSSLVTIASTVLTSAAIKRALRLAQNAKSAETLCDSCAIGSALSLVAMQQGHGRASRRYLDSIAEHKRPILIENLANFAALLGNTDTMPTIQSLKMLFGSALHAIDASTSKVLSEPITESGPLRFRYVSKASKRERDGSKHPTVKPIALMRYLCRLITPPGGTILDPFAGSGTTGEAALLERFTPLLIEQDKQYIADIRRRLKRAA